MEKRNEKNVLLNLCIFNLLYVFDGKGSDF